MKSPLRFHLFLLGVALFCAVPAITLAQSSSTLTQTVSQRNTIGVLTASPSSSLTAGEAITFSYVLHTAGAPAPTSETVQFYDGASAIGSAQTIGSISAANLLPYSQVDTTQGWTAIGSPTVSPSTGTGADGSSSSSTQLTLPSSSSAHQGASLAVSTGSYASSTLTFSFWAKASAATTLTLALTDDPALNASGSTTCSLTTSYQRCTLTYAFPSNANSGFIASLYTTLQSAVTVNIWGVQVEAASTAGPYVSTIGTARSSGGQGGTISFAYSSLLDGSHSITAVYGGGFELRWLHLQCGFTDVRQGNPHHCADG